MVTTRIRTVAAAASLAAVVALGGCVSTFTAQPYTPGVGVNADAGQVKARALVLVLDGQSAHLTGSIVSTEADTLTSVKGTAQDSSFNDLGALTFPDARVAIPSNKLVPLTPQNLVATSPDLKAGLTAKLTLTFDKSGTTTVVVPIVSNENPDYTPQPTNS
ncbi:hypothetical protein ACQB6R_02585 [Propionibacteriaceae bacterium G1746]|uniref:hypothetical protein n=1 Tax=Aestuariimicrobium sp. G57 TaxID=3418485 RepID=UPI003C1E04E9